ncbi:MAG: extracellular solute-binding protein [Nitrospiraceae bacterium]|nr:extracellular solute-binding protein [Nitrospiraceae bacterium]
METEPRSRIECGRRWAGRLGVATVVMAGLFLLAFPSREIRKHPERKPVRLWHMWTAKWKEDVDRIVAEFNASQNTYEVIALSVPESAADAKFLLAVAGGDPPDLMAQWNQVIPEWAENGVIMPLDRLMTLEERRAFDRDVYPVARRMGAYRGKLYAIPVGLDVYACYCRLDHLREAGLDPDEFPQTLEGLMDWGERLNRFDDSGRLTRLGFLPFISQLTFPMFAPAFGGGFFDWERGKLTIDTPENLRALRFLYEAREKLGLRNVIRFYSGLADGVGSAAWPFMSGQFSICVDGQWRVGQLAKYGGGIEYMTAPIPPPEGGRRHAGWVGGNFLVIPTGARHTEGAWAFMKFWSGLENPERAARFYTWGGWLPLSRAVADAPAYQQYLRERPQFRTFLDLLPSENLTPTPPVPYQTFLWDRVREAYESVSLGHLKPQEAIARLKRDVSREAGAREQWTHHGQ